MDISTALWAAWAIVAGGGFFLLERKGLQSTRDRWYSLTNRIRVLQRLHPLVRALIYGGVVALATFLVMHFAVDPAMHPGA